MNNLGVVKKYAGHQEPIISHVTELPEGLFHAAVNFVQEQSEVQSLDDVIETALMEYLQRHAKRCA